MFEVITMGKINLTTNRAYGDSSPSSSIVEPPYWISYRGVPNIEITK